MRNGCKNEKLMESIIIWCSSLTLLLVLVPGQRIHCSISGSVYEGDPASLVCDYEIDLEKQGKGLYIYKYPFGGEEPDLPAICDWENEFLRCEVSSGYEVRLQGQRLTLNMSSAQQTHAGRYACHVLQPEEHIQSEECDLVVQSRKLSPLETENIDCHAVRDPFREQLSTIMCFVPSGLNGISVVLERHVSSKARAERIIRCNIESKMCETRHFGYLFSIQESPSTRLKAMVAVVNRPGIYTCKVVDKHEHTSMCSVKVDEDTNIGSAQETSQNPNVVTHALLGSAIVLSSVLIVAVLGGIWYCKRRSKNSGMKKRKEETSLNQHLKSNLQHKSRSRDSICLSDESNQDKERSRETMKRYIETE